MQIYTPQMQETQPQQMELIRFGGLTTSKLAQHESRPEEKASEQVTSESSRSDPKSGKIYQKWTMEDMTTLKQSVEKWGSNWRKIQSEIFPTRTVEQIAAKFFILKHDLMKKNKGFLK